MKASPRPPVVPTAPPLPIDKLTARQSAERYIRAHPLKAMGQAAAAGFFLRFLPVRTLLAVALRLALPTACATLAMKSLRRPEFEPQPVRPRRRSRPR